MPRLGEPMLKFLIKRPRLGEPMLEFLMKLPRLGELVPFFSE